ncbi:streptomycin biosynthesis protein [Actinosynnema sp. NPDC023794]
MSNQTRHDVPRASPTTGRTPTRVPIATLVLADSPRVDGENDEHVRLLANLSEPLPPILVQRGSLRVIDGRHRLRAAVLRGDREIDVHFYDGDANDSFLLAVQINITHGLPLSLVDRSAAAHRVAKANPLWSDAAIAEAVGLDPKTVAAQRRGWTDVPEPAARIGRDGRVRPIDTAARRQEAGRLLAENPNASLRQIAQEAGISLGTASDVRKRVRSGISPVPTGRPAAAPDVQVPRPRPGDSIHAEPNARVLFQRLRQDPSLRFSEPGRALLRWLEFQMVDADVRERLLSSVPPHWLDGIAVLAQRCSGAWQEFSEQLEERRNTISSESR